MKKIPLFLLLATLVTATASSQTWVSSFPRIYISPDTTKVGIGISYPIDRLHVNNGVLRIGNSATCSERAKNLLKFGDGSYVQIGEWEANNTLSFKASMFNFTIGNVGIGIASPIYKLDVNGRLYLRAAQSTESYIHWQWNTLVLGTPAGTYSHNSIDIIPGGESAHTDTLFSRIRMFESPSETNHIEKIRLWTAGNCWFMNNGYLGIGTTSPQYKLDVRGTIRATEIIVNTAGADFVFDKEYKLPTLTEVDAYIKENGHLPAVPAAEEMQSGGMKISELQTLLLQKIEELTLYTIQLENRIKELENNQNQK